MSQNKKIIENMRQLFLKEYEVNRHLYNENDIKNIRENDWPILRHLLVNKTEEQALKSVIKAMQWRNSFGVHNFNDLYFPYEIYKIGEMFQFGCDKDGRPVLWVVGKAHHKSEELGCLIRQFIVYQIEKIDRQVSHQGCVVVSDWSGCELSNVDMGYSRFLVEVLQSYYPKSAKYVYTVEMPWILSATSKLIMAFMSEELKNINKFIKKKELTEYIDSDIIPGHMLGNNAKSMIEIPIGVKKLDQLTHFGFNSKQIDKIYATFKCLKEM